MNWKKLFAPNGKVVRPGKEEFMKSKQKNRNIPPGDCTTCSRKGKSSCPYLNDITQVCCGAYRKGVK